jgi:hypothetical protein
VYNKAASNIVIEADSDEEAADAAGVVCRPARPLARQDLVVTRLPDPDDVAPAPAAPANPLYRQFVRSSAAAPTTTAPSEDARRDYSLGLDDAAMLAACEGRRFGHRGSARQDGKAARLAAQDRALAQARTRSPDADPPAPEEEEEGHARPVQRRKKRQREAVQGHEATDAGEVTEVAPPHDASADADTKAARQQRRRQLAAAHDAHANAAAEVSAEPADKKKKKKKQQQPTSS